MSAGKSESFRKEKLKYPQTSKERREQENKGLDELKSYFKLSHKKSDDLSKLQILHYASVHLKWNKQKAKLNQSALVVRDDFKNLLNLNDLISNRGFAIVLSRDGLLLYVSDNVQDYLGFSQVDVLLGCNSINELLHEHDEKSLNEILKTKDCSGKKYQLYVSWFVNKIKRKSQSKNDLRMFKMTGHFIPTEIDNELFIALCEPMLTNYKQSSTIEWSNTFSARLRTDLKFENINLNGQSLLGYDHSTYNMIYLNDLVHPNDLNLIKMRHEEMSTKRTRQNTKSSLDSIRLLTNMGFYLQFIFDMQFALDSIELTCQLIEPQEVQLYKNYLKQIDLVTLTSRKVIKKTKRNHVFKFDSDDASPSKKLCYDSYYFNGDSQPMTTLTNYYSSSVSSDCSTHSSPISSVRPSLASSMCNSIDYHQQQLQQQCEHNLSNNTLKDNSSQAKNVYNDFFDPFTVNEEFVSLFDFSNDQIFV